MTKTRMLVVLGTRPEAIKLAPVVRALKSPCASATPDDSQADVVICSTGQHREMLASALGSFGLKADLDLALMQDNQDLVELLGRSLIGLRKVIADVQPDVVISQGDTTTAMASGLAAFFMGKRFAHVEAGLRTGDRQHPFPEEVNRRIAGVTADIHFAPTEAAASALLNEGVHSDSIFLTGNTVVDATQWALELSADRPLPGELDPGDAPLLLVTAHRRENFGKPFEELCRGIQEIARRFPALRVIYPVHLNPNVRAPVEKILGNNDRITLVEPLDYLSFLALMNRAKLILSDSGGVQEEAPALGKPVLVMREVTERPEAVVAGNVKLVGTNAERIVETASALLGDPVAWESMAQVRPVYGDGLASQRIREVLLNGTMHTKPFQEWKTEHMSTQANSDPDLMSGEVAMTS
ncbi:MAG: UDP-N-acetylglucosamine 2-epimerase (non-hydrolyzing) [Planctomycetota bacterium]|nr:UDP-N-acetylglucosamine 2-epimerase (non-hydrolyzing) [Planctomycetota bacterium]